MSGQAQADQVEAQAAQVEQESHREDIRESKVMDSKLLAPKFNANPRLSAQAFSKAIDDDKRSVTSNESNQKAIRDRSSKVEMQRKRLLRLLVVIACPLCVCISKRV